MRPGWNPTRRNRNIGTSKQGRGRNNRFVIPERGRFVQYWENLTSFTKVSRKVRRKDVTFLVEPARRDCAHACTVDDIVEILGYIPADDLTGLDLIILRQPKRKEELLDFVWGRLLFCVKIGRHEGPAIMLEAVTTGRKIRWGRDLRPDEVRELDRLREDGHEIETTKRSYVIKPTLDSVRSTQLYRTLPHEVGHWVDWLETVDRPSQKNPALWDVIEERYWQVPYADREAFAHRYADEFRAELRGTNKIPFERKLGHSS